MFYLIKKNNETNKATKKKFAQLTVALTEADTSDLTSFEMWADIWKSFHWVGERRNDGKIDWGLVPEPTKNTIEMRLKAVQNHQY